MADRQLGGRRVNPPSGEERRRAEVGGARKCAVRRRTHWPRRPSWSACTDFSGRRRRVLAGPAASIPARPNAYGGLEVWKCLDGRQCASGKRKHREKAGQLHDSRPSGFRLYPTLDARPSVAPPRESAVGCPPSCWAAPTSDTCTANLDAYPCRRRLARSAGDAGASVEGSWPDYRCRTVLFNGSSPYAAAMETAGSSRAA